MRPDAIILFDDDVAAAFHPFTMTRPAGELRLGALTMRERVSAVFAAPCAGHIAGSMLAGWDEPGAAAVIDAAAVPTDRAVLWWCARAVPAWDNTLEGVSEPTLLFAGDEAAGWFAPAGSGPPPEAFLASPAAWAAGNAETPRCRLDGVVLAHVWELVTRNAEWLAQDIVHAPGAASPDVPSHVAVIAAAGRVRVGRDVSFEPNVVLDCTDGPVWFDDGVRVRAFTRIAGPAYFGRGTTVLGGSFTAVSIGPACKVRGEIEESVLLGYANKAHDGFIGHACIGCWVNLGAFTTNSDLKNNYGTVRIRMATGDVDTGEMKIGCFLGDHVKTAIGTLLTTGAVVGPGANLFGAGQPPRYVRPFAWGSSGAALHEFARFIDTARIAMRRRGVELTAGVEAVLQRAWNATAGIVP
jgi:UDP-N-acetylglucosamine diphosphorylase/glucosamine-1-phosphate N-acetyltransferase